MNDDDDAARPQAPAEAIFEALTPPWPGLVHVPGAVVTMPACALWPTHESWAEPCWLEPQARPLERDDNATPPSAAQLGWAVAAGVATLSELEQTASELLLERPTGEPRGVPLAYGPGGAVVAEPPPARARRALPLTEERPRWRMVARPCVPRHGRGHLWPAVRERSTAPGGPAAEAWLLDADDEVALVREESGWALISTSPQEHALAWVPADALVDPAAEDARSDDGELALDDGELALDDGELALDDGELALDDAEPAEGGAERRVEPATARAGEPGSDAPMIDAILRLARAAVERLEERQRRGGHASAQVPERVAELLEAWAASGLGADERLAALSATDLVLLALAVAPALDRSLALAYRALAAPEVALTVGLLADLAGERAPTRVRLVRRLGAEQPLRRYEVLTLATEHEVPTAAAEVAAAPWVLAALYS